MPIHKRSIAVGTIWAVATILGTTAGQAGAQELRGSVVMETRLFTAAPAFPEQDGAATSPSLALQPEFLWENERGTIQLRATPFVRFDADDARRTHADIREAGVRVLGDGWTLFGGVGKVFWGKTEAHHLIDIVNQTDGVERLDGEAKLGQPMLNATLERAWGALDVYLLPYFRTRTHPGVEGRLRGAFPVLDEPIFKAGSGRWHPDVAIRWASYVGELDLGVSVFRGTSREPRYLPETDASGRVVLRPSYAIIDQVSLDAQWTRGATLWKLEALTRGGHGDRFGAAVAGIEHTFFGVNGTASDVGLLAEVTLDGRGPEAPPTVFDHDAFTGIRWAWNDVADTSILGGPVIDYHKGEVLARVEAQRRVGERWVAEVELNWVARTESGSPLHGLRRDDVFTIRMRRYF